MFTNINIQHRSTSPKVYRTKYCVLNFVSDVFWCFGAWISCARAAHPKHAKDKSCFLFWILCWFSLLVIKVYTGGLGQINIITDFLALANEQGLRLVPEQSPGLRRSQKVWQNWTWVCHKHLGCKIWSTLASKRMILIYSDIWLCDCDVYGVIFRTFVVGIS